MAQRFWPFKQSCGAPQRVHRKRGDREAV